MKPTNIQTSKSEWDKQLIADRYRPRQHSYLKLNNVQKLARSKVIEKIASGRYQLITRVCPQCESEDFIVVADRDRYSLPVQTVICKDCSLLMTNPVMRDMDYADFYQNHYTSLYDGFQYSPEEFFENQRAAGKRLHDTIKKHIILDNKVIAEVGCAAGGILFYLKDYCKDVLGCDYGTDFMEMGREKGLNIKVGGLAVLRQDRPDLIIYSHVLEHILDINKELDEIYEMLPQGGLLVIDVPGIYNIDKAYGADFLRYLQNAHLLHFCADSLQNMMAAHGLKTIFVDERCIGIFEKMDSKKIEIQNQNNDYRTVVNHLYSMEKLYIWYKIKAYPRKFIVELLKTLGIHGWVRSIYRKFIN